MDLNEATAKFAALTKPERLVFLARYGHQLTIVARSAYGTEIADVVAKDFFRKLFEIQHRLFSYMASLMTDDDQCFSAQAMVSILLGDESIRGATVPAFANVHASPSPVRAD
jgi:hypothetical protein